MAYYDQYYGLTPSPITLKHEENVISVLLPPPSQRTYLNVHTTNDVNLFDLDMAGRKKLFEDVPNYLAGMELYSWCVILVNPIFCVRMRENSSALNLLKSYCSQVCMESA